MSDAAIVLPGELRIGAIDELMDLLQARLDLGTALQLDASAVDAVDFCGIQVLSVLTQTAKAKDLPVQWVQSSESLDQAADLIGLRDALGLAAS